jgi:hypothetical protein
MLRRTGSIAITASQAGRIAPVPLHAGPAWRASFLPRISPALYPISYRSAFLCARIFN